jgi:hypothetical protein
MGDPTALRAKFGREVNNPRTQDGTPRALPDFNPSGVASAVAGTEERIEAAIALLAGLEGAERARMLAKVSTEMVLANLGQYRSATR